MMLSACGDTQQTTHDKASGQGDFALGVCLKPYVGVTPLYVPNLTTTRLEPIGVALDPNDTQQGSVAPGEMLPAFWADHDWVLISRHGYFLPRSAVNFVYGDCTHTTNSPDTLASFQLDYDARVHQDVPVHITRFPTEQVGGATVTTVVKVETDNAFPVLALYLGVDPRSGEHFGLAFVAIPGEPSSFGFTDVHKLALRTPSGGFVLLDEAWDERALCRLSPDCAAAAVNDEVFATDISCVPESEEFFLSCRDPIARLGVRLQRQVGGVAILQRTPGGGDWWSEWYSPNLPSEEQPAPVRVLSLGNRLGDLPRGRVYEAAATLKCEAGLEAGYPCTRDYLTIQGFAGAKPLKGSPVLNEARELIGIYSHPYKDGWHAVTPWPRAAFGTQVARTLFQK